MIREEDLIKIGKFQKTHALKGELNMISEVAPEYYKEGNPLIIPVEGIFVPFYVDNIREKGSTSFLVKLDGIESEEDAARFVNSEIYMLRKDKDEWLEEDNEQPSYFVGFEIIDDETGKVIGQIKDIDDTTANILFIVEDEEENVIYLPAVEEFIKEIDENSRQIRMTLPSGLLDLNN